VSCGSLDDASAIEYLELVDVVVLFTERNKLSVRKARAAADRLRAMGIAVLGVVVGA
jgi:Mrp family chromosome partitioning ATPase